MTPQISSSQLKSPTCHVWWWQALWKRRFKFVICQGTPRDHVIWGLCIIVDWVPLITSHYHPKFGGHRALCKRRCFFSLSHDLTCWYGQGVTWHNRRVSLIISDYPTKYGDHRPCGRGDIKLSVYHVISLDHVIRGSRDIWMSFLIVSQCPVTFTGHRSRGIGDIKLLIYNVISRNQVVRGSCEIMGEFPSS